MKIALACVVIAFLLAVPATWRWYVGEEDLSGITLVIWPIVTIGIVLCLISIVRELVGNYSKRNRS
jgi:hypothetical protein